MIQNDPLATLSRFSIKELFHVFSGRGIRKVYYSIHRSFSLFLDLQFALAYQTASADTEAELRSLITGLHVESDSSKELVLSLQAELEKSQQKVIELEEQLRWQELEKQNQLNIKEAKIQELLKGLNISSNDPKVLIKYCIKVRKNRKEIGTL